MTTTGGLRVRGCVFFFLIVFCARAYADDLVGRIDSLEPQGKRLRAIITPLMLDPPRQTQRLRLSLPSKNNTHLRPGDTVAMIAKIYPPYPPLVPGGFDWQRWLYEKNISHIGYSMGRVQHLSGDISNLSRWQRLRIEIERARYDVTQRWIHAAPDPETGAFAAALFTGMRGAISASLVESMRVAGLTHLLSISGLHMSLVAGLVYLTFRYALALFVFRFPVKAVAAALAWVFSLIYLAFSGADIPTQRSFIMISLVLLAVITHRQPFSLWTVFVAACVVLMMDHQALSNPGFQMSFMAVISLIVYYQRHRPMFEAESTRLRTIGLYFYGLFISTFWVNITTAPIVAWHFYRFNLYGPLANMVAIPLSSFFLMPLIILAALATPFGLEGPFLWLFSLGSQPLFDLTYAIESWPAANILLGAYDQWAFFCFVLAAFLFLFLRGWRQLFGLLPVGLGLLLMSLTVRADMLISHDGRHLVMIHPKSLTIYTRRPSDFIFEKWADYWGVPMDQVTVVKLLEKDPPADLCANNLCLIPYKLGHVAAMPLSASALAAGCARSDIDLLITPYTAPEACRAKTIVDRASLAKTGAQLIWFAPYRVLTDYDVRGPQPWNAFEKQPKNQPMASSP